MRRFFQSFIFLFCLVAVSYGQDSLRPGTSSSPIKSTLFRDNGYPYALVAGGSKGIGFAIAEALARRKFNLVLVARGRDSLENAGRLLTAAYGVHVELLSYDLSDPGSVDAVAKWCLDRQLPLKMLCNVAGLGGAKDYLSLPVDSVRYMVDLNISSGMALVQHLLPLLSQQAPSYILNVGSMAAFAPIPQKNMYAATKAAVLFFSYALRYQLKDKDISVSCLTPGPVFTKPEIRKDTEKRLGFIGKMMAVPPERVGEIAVRKTLSGKMIIVPGTLAKMFSGFLRVMPRRWAAAGYSQFGG
ncbi:MAG: SDR family NAD(P)-dependent oxidoreductase [Sphingobacteriales bacterium]|nr:MAG: SDR family NAD(P)-dependent oxidoreductase [Sphingobacteriales bacterium]